MVDRAGAVNTADLDFLASRSVEAVAGYIGGQNNGGSGWTQSVVAEIVSRGFLFLPIWVGPNVCPDCGTPVDTSYSRGYADGKLAVSTCQQLGIVSGPLCADIEEPTVVQYPDIVNYCTGFVAAVDEFPTYLSVVYGPPLLFQRFLPEEPCGAWYAWWNVPHDLSTIDRAGQRAGLGWQYQPRWNGYDLSEVDGRWWKVNNLRIDPSTWAGEVIGDVRYFKETGFQVEHGFRSFWEEFGGLPTFGFPISKEYIDSEGLNVQYFQRARFEWHSGSNPARYDTELGLVGSESWAYNRDVALHSDAFQPHPPPAS